MNSTAFTSFDLEPRILSALFKKGYQTPTPIQQQAIPFALQGRDVLGCAQTGTGKTAAFAIPILQRLHQSFRGEKSGVKVLVVTPTRELALQIEENFSLYGKGLGFKQAVIFGGVGQAAQIQKLKRGVDILIATPGRLLDLCGQGYIGLKQIEMFVLDEADRMLDMGFINDARKIVALLPESRQSFFFSATMPPSVKELAQSFLNHPQRVEVTPVSSTAETVSQRVYMVAKDKKRELLSHLLQTLETPSILIFTRTKHGANKLASFITNSGFRAEAIHANKSQSQREKALKNFKNRKTRVLIATDIASRGIDIVELPLVINFDLPNEPETYVHRIGRTGRAEKSGTAFSFCNEEELGYLRDIHKLIGKCIRVEEDHPYAEPYEVLPIRVQTTVNKKKTRRKAATFQKPEKKLVDGKFSKSFQGTSPSNRGTSGEKLNENEAWPRTNAPFSKAQTKAKKRTHAPLKTAKNPNNTHNKKRKPNLFALADSINTEIKDSPSKARGSRKPPMSAFRTLSKSMTGKNQRPKRNKTF